MRATVQGLGTEVLFIAGMTAQDGRLRLINARLEGPAAGFLSADAFVTPIEQQINEQLLVQGRTIQTLRIEQGQIVVQVP
ncbi:MAG: hypothetical protein HC828_15205 [Blastochloris sp.]|nr:hypothetical protein [Blastochloris sp.]